MHRQKICHRDIKPENIIIDPRNLHIKIIDFGLSNSFDNEEGTLKTRCGSLGYATPELLMKKNYRGPPVDVWACGVILYTMIVGQLPFNEDSDQQTFEKIIKCEYEMPGNISRVA